MAYPAPPEPHMPPELLALLEHTFGTEAAKHARVIGVGPMPIVETALEPLANDEAAIVRIYRKLAADARIAPGEPRDFIFAAVPLSSALGDILGEAERMAICKAAAEGANAKLVELTSGEGSH